MLHAFSFWRPASTRSGILTLSVVAFFLWPAPALTEQMPTCSNPPSGTKPTLGFMLNPDLYLSGLQDIATSTEGTPSHTGKFLANHFFNRSESILFTNTVGSKPVPAGWKSRGGLKDDSYADLTKNEVTIGNTSGISVIIYDNEKWPGGDPNAEPPTGTPSSEQTAPASTTSSFVGWAHDHFLSTTGKRYTAMSTPGRDLASLQSDYISSGGLDDYYLNTNPPYTDTGTNRPFAHWASDADIFEIQAQAHTADGKYVSFVTRAGQQAVTKRPSVQLMAGVSTAYGTDTQICDAVVGTYQLTQMIGYWLNFPTGNPTHSEYLKAINFLNLLYNDGF
jgi:hypothetical protein